MNYDEEEDESGGNASPGARLTDLRELLQLTQTELAKKAGVPQSTISAVERGDRELSPKLIAETCAAVRIPLSLSIPTSPS